MVSFLEFYTHGIYRKLSKYCLFQQMNLVFASFVFFLGKRNLTLSLTPTKKPISAPFSFFILESFFPQNINVCPFGREQRRI